MQSPSNGETGETLNETNPTNLVIFGREFSRNTVFFIVEGLCFVGFLICAIQASIITWTDYNWRFYSFGAAMFVFCLLFAEANRRGRFHEIVALCYQWRYPIITLFLIFALTDLILLRLSDMPTDCSCDKYVGCGKNNDCGDKCDNAENDTCPLIDPEKYGVRYFTRTLTAISGVLFVGCVLGYWELSSYTAATNDWIIAVLYMTVLGYIWLYFSRSLMPPDKNKTNQDNWSWHQKHDENRVLSRIVILMVVGIVFFVIMGAIVLALFGDAANATGNLGTVWGILIFSFISFIIMITPLAPGSVVDIAAGFLFVTLFVKIENMDVIESFFVALAITIVLHFIGSCLQYYVGKIRAVQIWGNKNLPPQLLAASDSVLKTANWLKVGIVGQVFMDTANGLNQGRMDMDFCTQFWSEYASIPNAISLVALGTVLAIEGFSAKLQKQYEWSDDAIPLIIMVAWLWQMMGSSWGFKELLQSVHTTSYWTALEKWETVQYFSKLGYTPTHKGWNEDIYELSISRGDRICLFSKVKELHPPEQHRQVTKESMKHYLSKLCKKPQDSGKQRQKMIESIKLDRERSTVRQSHWDALIPNFEQYVQKGLLKKTQKNEPTVGIFEKSEGSMMYLHYLITLAIYITGLGSYYYVSRPIGLDDAVEFGIKVLEDVPPAGWVFFTIFWILVIIYFFNSFKSNAMSFASGIKFVFTGMQVDPEWETVYNTPQWENNNNDNNNNYTEQSVASATDVNLSNNENAVLVKTETF